MRRPPQSNLTPRRSMEEVWKDLTLPTLHTEIPATPPLPLQHHLPRTHHPSAAAAAAPSSLTGIVLKDFLSGPHNREAPPPPSNHPYPSHPSIDLNLDSSCHSPMLTGHNPQSAGFCNCRKRVIEQQAISDGLCTGSDWSSDGRRQKRIIKNRESAARSRARKQAYTNELELEVAHLVRENAKLRRKYEDLRSAMAAQVTTKRKIQRSSSALL